MNQNSIVCRIYSGWLGKMIGVRLGAPVEMWTREQIEEKYHGQHGYLCDYNDFAADDDTNGPVFFIRSLEESRKPWQKLTSKDVSRAWLQYASWGHGMYWWGGYGISSENTAYENLRADMIPPVCSSAKMVGKTLSEQIGGQIFIDAWGLICPGDPVKAAALAEQAAHVAHDGEAVYGGMFVAACIAAAFTAKSVGEMLEVGLKQIPADSEYAKCVRQVMAWHDEIEDAWECFAKIREQFWRDKYPGACHIIPNIAIMILALCYGDRDFSRTIELCNQCGFDTDCNVGNVGTMMGVLCGLDALKDWRSPINDFFVCSGAVGSLNIRDAAEFSAELARLAVGIGSFVPTAEEKAFLDHPARWNFLLPGSTQDVQIERGDEVTKDAVWTPEGLKIKPNGGACRAFVRTYVQPKDLFDNRYDPAFSPLVYPGQTIEITVEGESMVRVYAEDCDGNRVYGEDASSGTLALCLPKVKGSCWARIGVESDAPFVLKSISWNGTPDYELNAADLRWEHWAFSHTEISQFTNVKGAWRLEDGKLRGAGAQVCRVLTGGADWTDYAAEATLNLETADAAGLLVRASGAMRGYLIQVDRRGFVKVIREDIEKTELVSAHVPDTDCYELRVEVRGGSVLVTANGAKLPLVTDPDPLLTGGVGFDVACPGSASFHRLAVRPLKGESV